MIIKVSRNLFIVLVMDIFLLILSFYLAHQIRFDFQIPEWANEGFWELLPLVLGIKLICFYFFDLYRGMWRYTSLNDVINVVKGAVLSTILTIVAVLFINRFQMVSRSVFIIDWCFTIIFIICLRVMTRLCFEKFSEEINFRDIKNALLGIFSIGSKRGKGVLVIGAGDCGEKICREFRENASMQSYIIGFLDDDVKKIGRKIHGIPILDTIANIKEVVRGTAAQDIVIAIPSLGASRMREIVELCKASKIGFKTVPSLGELIDGKVSIKTIRDVEYRDLLGREPVVLDRERIGNYLGQKVVLVTGAAGSIGKGLCRQICRYNPKTLILFEWAESPLYEVDLELKRSFPNVEILPVLGNVQNYNDLESTFEQTHPQIVFHAAAYKHVPMLEHHPWKAVENNIQGTENLVAAAHAFGCEKFVLVSTDKAVNPSNVMGASKRIAEILVQHQNLCCPSSTSYITVRFGNVIGSVGSVIPLFKRQIQEGGPVTVTHPEVIRYFMLIPEACQLILQAGAMGNGGEIYILEMGAPVKIDTMARDLIRFSGYKPDIDIKVEYTGLRPGEKLFEELVAENEQIIPTEHKKIMVLKSRVDAFTHWKNYIDSLKMAAAKRDKKEIRDCLMTMLPDYLPADSQDAIDQL